MMRLLRLFPLLLGLTMAAPATAQTAVANGTAFGDWQLSCRAEAVGQTACALIQILAESSTNTFLAEIALNYVPNAEGDVSVVMGMRTPAGMLLPVPPAFRVDGSDQERPMQWRTCAGEFCSALLPLTESDLAAMRAGATMIVGYQPVSSAQPVSFPVSLRGVTAGLRALTGN